MNAPLPPLGGLRAFEAAARHVSISLAARELNVTPGAVSLQIKQLEASLGVRLFVRRPRNITLTPQGEDYFATVRTAFRMVREASAHIVARSRIAALTISCTPAFAVQWLVPRLAGFEAHHPGIDIRVSATNRMADFAREGIDLAVRHGFGRYDGLISERLVDDDLVPVCSPSLQGSREPISTPNDLQNFALLHDEHRHDWRLWLEAAGAGEVDASRGTVFTDSNGAIEAAKAGAGVCLVRLSLVQAEIAQGALIVVLPHTIANGLAYHLVYPATALDRAGVAAFRNWLVAETAKIVGRDPSK